MSEIVSEELNEQAEDAHASVPDEIHMPSPSIAPLVVGIGVTLLLTGLIAPVLGVIGLVVALVGGLRMAHFGVDMHSSFLQHLNNRKLGMWAFIASEVMFFTSLIATFIRFKIEHGAEFEEAHEIMSLPLATIGTTVLIVSSFAVVMGLEAIQSNDRRVFFNWIGLTILFGARS
jgi:hypothetical protein